MSPSCTTPWLILQKYLVCYISFDLLLSKVNSFWTAVLAQKLSTRLVTKRSWVQILPDTGLFSILFLSLYRSTCQWCVFNQVHHGGATPLIFLEKCMLSCAA